MSSLFVILLVLGVAQTAFSQAFNYPNGCPNGPNGFVPNGINCVGPGFGNGVAPYGNGLAPYGNGYPCQTVGYGDVAVAGELPVGGNTAIAGQVPVIGYVLFEGNIPAGGMVSVANNCGCNGVY